MTDAPEPLPVEPPTALRYVALPGLEFAASRIGMGIDLGRADEHSAPLLDRFFELGGNLFDTARVYGGGRSERVLGQWIARRGVREQVIVVSKGAHTPHCNPEALPKQLERSLATLELDQLDVYLMHRDNPLIPVGEFIDVLNEQFRAGKVRIFGASNWSVARLEAANAYAASRGLEPLRVLSNQLSLARMVSEPWPGCVASWDSEQRAFLRAQQMPLLAWSPGARGFFEHSEPSAPSDSSDSSDSSAPSEPAPTLDAGALALLNAWHSADNFERRRRAQQLARARGVTPTAVSLAYVLGQAFPTLAVIGPKTVAELEQSFESLALRLSLAEMTWLDLESDSDDAA